MNRRDFLRLSVLVPVALVTKFQVEPEPFEIVSPSETFLNAFEKFPEDFQQGYEMGRRIVEGCIEGIQVGSVNAEVTWDLAEFDEDGLTLNWPNSDNYDPIADLQAVQDWMLDKVGFEDKYKLIAENGRIRYAPS